MPDDVDWHFVFKVQDEDVLRVCPPANAAQRAKRFHSRMVSHDFVPEGDGWRKEEESVRRDYAKKLQDSQNGIRPLRYPLHAKRKRPQTEETGNIGPVQTHQ